MRKFITSWDDGAKQDIGLAEMLQRYNIPAMFFIPSNCELSTDNIKHLFRQGFGIGGHTMSHPEDIKTLSVEDQAIEIAQNKGWLEGIIGRKINWFCYPSGKYNKKTIGLVKKMGYKYARTTVVMNTDGLFDPYSVSTSIHICPIRKEYRNQNWLEIADKLWEEFKNKDNGYFHLWGHSWEIEKYNLWEQLDEFLKKISSEYDLIAKHSKNA